MLFLKLKDVKARKALKKKESLKISFKFSSIKFFNKNVGKYRTYSISNSHIRNLCNQVSNTKIVRRCIVSNRGRGTIRPFHISRIKLKEFIKLGIIPGFKKAV